MSCHISAYSGTSGNLFFKYKNGKQVKESIDHVMM